MFFIISWLITSFLQGLFFFLILVFLLYWFYLKELPVNKTPLNKPQFENYELNANLRNLVDNEANTAASTSTNDLRGDCQGVIALNMIFQFLFQELKDTKAVRRYIIRKMSAEFKELLTTKAAGKIVQRITARDFSLGTSFPIIHSLKLNTYKMDEAQKSLQEMSVIVDLEYTNGFSISIDADLILGRSAYIHIKVVSIKGKARIQFSRSPFTHWNFAFIEDPQIEFDANSHFDGRQIPQLTALILNQLRRSVRRKHTLPNYKCRFKPFFDQIYNQNLFKANIDDMLFKTSTNNHEIQKQSSSNMAKNQTNNLPRSVSNSSIDTENVALSNIQQQLNELSIPLNGSDPSDKPVATPMEEKNPILKSFDRNSSYQYRKLCEKLGFNLTTIGQLVISYKICDRLPEALYGLNLPQYQLLSTQQQIQTNSQAPNQPTLPTSVSSYSLNSQQDSCFIYLTTSIDKISMKSLMNKQICKEHWPLIEFEMQKTNALQTIQSLGFSLTEFFLINRNEVVIQKVIPNTVDLVKVYDIIYSINQVRVSSVKQLNKLIQKTPVNTSLKFIVQRPCILMENKVNSSTSVTAKKLVNQDIDSSKPNAPNTASAIVVNPQVVSNTRTRFEYFEKKIKSSFGSTGITQLNPTDSSTAVTPTTPVEASQAVLSPQTSTIASNPNQTQSLITASSHCLVDYFCSVSECSINDQLANLDLINLLTDKDTSPEELVKRNECYFKKSKDIKLEKENLISFNNIPIQMDETYSFDLNENTDYLNIFLWTIQYTNKMSKMKHMLIGYITLPLCEINVDCWNTSKGETQTTVHFSPLDEFKASAASKLSRSHVISDHPGFDSSLSVGALTINFQHKLKKSQDQDTTTTTTAAHEIENDEVDIPQLTETIVEELVEQNKNQIIFHKTEKILKDNLVDDGSIHKFYSVQFNESVACEFCHKKIWFKNAFQCMYCNYKIHMKCYDKAFGKTICPRFFTKKPTNENCLAENEEPFEMIGTGANIETTTANRNDDVISINSATSSSTTRNLVSNFFSGIRQRRNQNQESQQTSNSFNILNTFNMSRNRPNNINSNPNLNNNNSDELSNVDLDEFKDIDSNEEKLFGTELFDELPLDERKTKFDELITKYQSTIDMMQRLKSDYEKELDLILKSKKNRVAKSFLNTTVFNQKEERLRSEIKHTDEQMKCVMFLLMQCQIGLSNCTDLQALNDTKSEQSSRAQQKEESVKMSTFRTDEDFIQ